MVAFATGLRRKSTHVRDHVCRILPYDLAKTRNSAIKQLIYMASPTGFEPVLPPERGPCETCIDIGGRYKRLILIR